ncbi:unnamed protein product [[Actinomadura] parvosata subsp. kistnae]|uniref:hypothetical protein n=1 Tax=[Actinomadura] parvosata TaxID=1955412 RepID=UPI000D27CEF9|nr:unnamed protein product [Actinomadura parvosata subsp. kistnae]
MNAPDPPKGGRRAALLLAVITPVIAELTLGNPPLSRIWLMLLWIPIYGAGTVLIRELVRRRRGGWPSILLLGLAYGIVEEGLALQALSSPTMYGVAGWAPRILGLNSAYAELNLPYHAVFSVALPILLTDLAFPSLRERPYLKRTGVVVAAVVFVLGGVLLRLTVAASIDPGYQAPAVVPAAYVAAVALLAVVALGVLPSRPAPRTGSHPAPEPASRPKPSGAAPVPWVAGVLGRAWGSGTWRCCSRSAGRSARLHARWLGGGADAGRGGGRGDGRVAGTAVGGERRVDGPAQPLPDRRGAGGAHRVRSGGQRRHARRQA